MCTNEQRLLMVAISKLKFNGFNPASRTRRTKKFLELRESMGRHGQLAPITVAKDYMILDGHRRTAVAIDLGWREIMAVMSGVNAQLAWAEMVQTTVGIDGKQAVEATAQGLDPAYLSAGRRQDVEQLQAMAGEQYAQLAAKNVGLHVVKIVRRVRGYLEWGEDENHTILMWLLDHAMQYQARKLIEADPFNERNTRAVIEAAIRSGRPIVTGAMVG